jgi:hypothetical protein
LSTPDTPISCVIAETAAAATRVGNEVPADTPQVLLESPAWRVALSPYAGGRAVIAIDKAELLAELFLLSSELARFSAVELFFMTNIEPAITADLLDSLTREGLHFVDCEEGVLRLERGASAPSALATARLLTHGLREKSRDRRSTGPLRSALGALRVGFVGTDSMRTMGGVVKSFTISPEWSGSLKAKTDGWLDLLVVDNAPSEWSRNDIEGAVEEAKAIGAAVVTLAGEPTGLSTSVVHRPWVDTDLISPIGYRRVTEQRLASVATPGSSTGSSKQWPGVDVVEGGAPADLVARLRPYAGVIDHPALHPSTADRAELLTTLATAGVPVVAHDVDPELRSLLGDELTDIITSAEPADLTDPETRDRLSIRLRRLRQVPAPLPLVSVVLPTNRPEFLDHALQQVARQTYPELELVVVLHGDGFAITDTEMEKRYGSPVTVVRVDSKTVFGEALNRGVAASSGTLVAKMDDDDWYAPEHLWDLVRAMDYSGADLVGKAAEFVYLEELDVTIRRMVDGSETYGHRNLAGGTFLIKRSTLDTIGGWRRIPRHVDQALLDDLEALAIPWYRTFGHGYLLHRRSFGHTWDADVDYFLDQSSVQWRGMAIGEALTAERATPSGKLR